MPFIDPTAPDEIRGVLDEIAALAREEVGDFEEFEGRLMNKLMAAGRAVIKDRIEAVSKPVPFTEGDKVWRVAMARSPREIMTLFGPVSVARPLFRSKRNAPTRCIVTERLGLICGFWTPRAARIGALAVAEMPMGRAEWFFSESGLMPASRSSLLRLAKGLSLMWEEERTTNEEALREDASIPANATLALVSLDGVMVKMVDSEKTQIKAEARSRGAADKGPAGCAEASVAVVALYDAEGNRIATSRYGRMPEEEKATTKEWLRAELAWLRKVRPDLVIVAIADGAPNLWKFLETLEADHEVVDFFHTIDHLHRHVSKANGASTLDTQAKLRQMRHDLLNVPAVADRVFADMQRLREVAGTEAPSTTKTSGRRQPTFGERHKGRMNYAELIKLGVPIGSGITEGTCKNLVCDRLRRTGMRWSEPGGQAVITLRSWTISGRFHAGWAHLTSLNRQRLAA